MLWFMNNDCMQFYCLLFPINITCNFICFSHYFTNVLSKRNFSCSKTQWLERTYMWRWSLRESVKISPSSLSPIIFRSRPNLMSVIQRDSERPCYLLRLDFSREMNEWMCPFVICKIVLGGQAKLYSLNK